MEKAETKVCQDCKNSFQIEPEYFTFYEKVGVSLPISCWRCRMKHLLAFWPFGKFNKRLCDKSGERIISLFPKDARFPVYSNKYWYSDDWAPPNLEYNPSKSFFDQMYELQSKTPRPMQLGSNNQNCDYCDDVWQSKNCYLCRSLLECENVSYSYRTIRCRDSYDLFYCFDTEQSYDCIYCFKVFNVKHSFYTRDSFDSAFLYDCRDARNCFMCWNLRHRSYCILNEQYTKEVYLEKIKQFNTGSKLELKKIFEIFNEHIKEDAVHRVDFNTKTVDGVGNYMTECRRCLNSYFFEESENCLNTIRGFKNKDAVDSVGILRTELVFNVCQVTDAYNLKNCSNCDNCRESEYLDFCVGCENCFGCVGLRKKKFCILNKQYGEGTYEEKKGEIIADMKRIGEYGNFFPYKMAYTGYNLSTSEMLFLETKEDVEKLGSFWEDLEQVNKEGLNVFSEKDDIKDVDDSVLTLALLCKETGRPFNVTRAELEFLRRKSIPLPDFYPDVRTMRRAREIFSISFYDTDCFKCGKRIVAYYSKESGYKKIACEACYNTEVA